MPPRIVELQTEKGTVLLKGPVLDKELELSLIHIFGNRGAIDRQMNTHFSQ